MQSDIEVSSHGVREIKYQKKNLIIREIIEGENVHDRRMGGFLSYRSEG